MSIAARSHLWVWWAEIAIEHEAEALEARRRLVDGWPTSGPEFVTERRASLVTIAAAASAIEAAHAEIAPLIGRAADAGGKQRGETFALASQDGKLWGEDLKWLNGCRNDGIHYKGRLRPLEPHPAVPTNVEAEVVQFASEQATRAVGVMFVVLVGLIRGQHDPRLTDWAERSSSALSRLLEARKGG